MRKLVQFLKKFRNFLVFLFLQIFVLSFFFNSKFYHKALLVNSSSSFVGWFIEKKYNISKHFTLDEANERLADENARLRAQLPQSFYKLQNDIFYVNDTLYEQQYEYISSVVINSSVNKRDNYLTLDKGRLQGVKEGMGVISDHGAVGFVIDVSDHFSLVKILLSEDINIPVKLAKNNEHWFLKWNGKDRSVGQVSGVTPDIDIQEGDTLVTRGSKTRFPANVMVGIIDEINAEAGEETLTVNVRFSVDFGSIYHVYIVRNLFADEQQALEADFFESGNE